MAQLKWEQQLQEQKDGGWIVDIFSIIGVVMLLLAGITISIWGYRRMKEIKRTVTKNINKLAIFMGKSQRQAERKMGLLKKTFYSVTPTEKNQSMDTTLKTEWDEENTTITPQEMEEILAIRMRPAITDEWTKKKLKWQEKGIRLGY